MRGRDRQMIMIYKATWKPQDKFGWFVALKGVGGDLLTPSFPDPCAWHPGGSAVGVWKGSINLAGEIPTHLEAVHIHVGSSMDDQLGMRAKTRRLSCLPEPLAS